MAPEVGGELKSFSDGSVIFQQFWLLVYDPCKHKVPMMESSHGVRFPHQSWAALALKVQSTHTITGKVLFAVESCERLAHKSPPNRWKSACEEVEGRRCYLEPLSGIPPQAKAWVSSFRDTSSSFQATKNPKEVEKLVPHPKPKHDLFETKLWEGRKPLQCPKTSRILAPFTESNSTVLWTSFFFYGFTRPSHNELKHFTRWTWQSRAMLGLE